MAVLQMFKQLRFAVSGWTPPAFRRRDGCQLSARQGTSASFLALIRAECQQIKKMQAGLTGARERVGLAQLHHQVELMHEKDWPVDVANESLGRAAKKYFTHSWMTVRAHHHEISSAIFGSLREQTRHSDFVCLNIPRFR
jgi:hypothetical protein